MKRNYFKKVLDPRNKEVILICEVSGNHNNSFSHLKKLINHAIKQKVDLVKFQVYRPETMTLNAKSKDFSITKINIKKWSKHKNLYNLYKKGYTPWHWIKKLSSDLDKKKINWFASAFDKSSVDFMEELNCKAYKIASPEITDTNLIEYIASKNKPIILSTGMADKHDLHLAVRSIKKYHSKFAILKCTSKYPASYSDLNLSTINKIKKRYKCAVGFSDHTLDDLAGNLSVTYGSTIIEKHFKLDGDQNSIDSHFSVPISKYSEIKKKLNNVLKCIGDENNGFKITKDQKNSRRSIYACKDIKKNTELTVHNIKSVRPGFGLHPKYYFEILGKKMNRDISAGTALKIGHIKF